MKKNFFIDGIFIIFLIIFSWANPSVIEKNLLCILIMIVYFTTLLSLVVISKKRRIIFRIFEKNILVFLIISFCFMSTIYSKNSQMTINQSIAILLLSLGTLNLCILYNEENILRIICFYICLSIISSVILFIISPNSTMTIAHGETLGFKGVFGHKNVLGRTMLIGSIIIDYYYRRFDKSMYKYVKYACYIMAVMSKSATVIILLITYICYKYCKKLFRYNIYKTINFLVIILFIVLVSFNEYFIGSSIESIFYKTTGKTLQFTGRIPIWNFMIRSWKLRPITGYGYGGFWEDNQFIHDMLLTTQTSIPIMGSHNGYFDLLVSMGLVGFILVSLILIKIYRENFYKNDYSTCIISMILICNLFDNVLLSNSLFWLLIVLLLNRNILENSN